MQTPANKRSASMGGVPYTPDFTPSFFQPGVGSQRVSINLRMIERPWSFSKENVIILCTLFLPNQ